MGEPEYTPGPWIRGWEHETKCAITAFNNGQAYDVATVVLNGGIRLGPPGANGNADRIIACINLCEGVPTAALLERKGKAELIRKWVGEDTSLFLDAELAFIETCCLPSRGVVDAQHENSDGKPGPAEGSDIIVVETADTRPAGQP
jgi:hypothetical protein